MVSGLIVHPCPWKCATCLLCLFLFTFAFKIIVLSRTGSFFQVLVDHFFALINTNLSEMAQIYIFIHYFFAHGLVIFIMLTLMIDGYRPRWVDYFNAIQWTTFLVVSIVIINLILGSNYMFTFEKPPGVNFTLLMPEWPYYFMIMLFIGLMFYTLLMLLSRVPQRNDN